MIMLTDDRILPRDILVNSILAAHLDISSLVTLSSCSKECRRIVYREVPGSTWSEIDLSGNDRITDGQLYALLKNVNARENTRSLRLIGCVRIDGPGLEPLRGSSVLEDIDLRVLGSLPHREGEGGIDSPRGPSGLEEDHVADILRSMITRCTPCNSSDCGTATSSIALTRVAIRPMAGSFSLTNIKANNVREIPFYASGRLRDFIADHDSLKR